MMLFRDLCHVLGTHNVLIVYDRGQEVLAYGLVYEIKRDRWYLMDKEVLSIDSDTRWDWSDSHIIVVLDTSREEFK